MEEVLLRFGHIAQKIFHQLDIQSLANCNKVNQIWQDFIHREKISSFKSIKVYSNWPNASIRKFLCKYNSNQAALLANNVTSVFKKVSYLFSLVSRDGSVLNATRGMDTPLHFAAENGFLEICEMLMENMNEKNPKNNASRTPLHLAAEKGHFEVCRLIVENVQCDHDLKKNNGYPCEINHIDHYRFTPLHIAAMKGHLQICNLIIKHVCDKNPMGSYNGITPLHYAAQNGHFQVCQLIVKNVQEKNPKDRLWNTPLHNAAKNGHLQVCKLIVKNVQEKNPMDRSGTTPLHNAAKYGHLKICQLLVENVQKKES